MIVFLDESSDAGFKLGQGSSRFFVISLVVFEENAHAEQVAASIQTLRQRLDQRSEFKFNKTRDTVRLQFLEAMRDQPFTVRSVIVDKKLVDGEALRRDQEEFYRTFVRHLLQRNQGSIQGAKLRIDGSGGREFQREFSAFLRRELGPVLADCKFRDSRTDSLIQLADMVAGATRRAFDPDKQNDAFYGLVRHKVSDE